MASNAAAGAPTVRIDEAAREGRRLIPEEVEKIGKGPLVGAAQAGPTRWWLIFRSAGRGVTWEALTVDLDGEEALAVFSFREEAEMFLELEGLARNGWRVRESRAGELASVLCGPCAGVEGVALDPPSEIVADRALALIYMGRDAFLDRLLWGGGRAS
ncbi:MAG: hypothetical protein M3R38_38950 [Actinomycetota bacterium]|nr:hypothetical protein [Actinomycetota bacterium]